MQDQPRVGRLRALELLLFILYRECMRIITFLLLLPTLSLASDDAQRRFEQLTAVVQSIRGDGPRVFYESEPNDENFIATPVLVPAKVLAQLESADDVDWFEIRTANQNQMSANVRGDRVEVLALLTPHRDEKVDGCEKNRDQGAEARSSIAINERTWQHQAEEAHP